MVGKNKRGLYNDPDNMTWDVKAPNLTQWRNLLGLSNSEAAKVLGISARSYGYYASGEQKIPHPVLMSAEFTWRYPSLAKDISRHIENQSQKE